MADTQESRAPEQGFSLFEFSASAALLAIMSMVILRSIALVQSTQADASTRANLQAHAERALHAILSDLRRSGHVTVTGRALPYVYDGGVASDPLFVAHNHPPAASAANPGDPDFGDNREIVFALPADADFDGRPDLAGGKVQWDARDFGYRVVTTNGVNLLQRTIDGEPQRTIASHIERIVFDTAQSSGWTIPSDTVRVRIFLRGFDTERRVLRHETEVTVRLRNPAI